MYCELSTTESREVADDSGVSTILGIFDSISGAKGKKSPAIQGSPKVSGFTLIICEKEIFY